MRSNKQKKLKKLKKVEHWLLLPFYSQSLNVIDVLKIKSDIMYILLCLCMVNMHPNEASYYVRLKEHSTATRVNFCKI